MDLTPQQSGVLGFTGSPSDMSVGSEVSSNRVQRLVGGFQGSTPRSPIFSPVRPTPLPRAPFDSSNPDEFLAAANLRGCLESLSRAGEVSLSEFHLTPAIAGPTVATTFQSPNPPDIMSPPSTTYTGLGLSNPPTEPVTPTHSDEIPLRMSAPELLVQDVLNDPDEYPDPHTVLPDPAAAERLLSSGLLQVLRSIPYPVLLNTGSASTPLQFGGYELDAYAQVLLKFASEYYSSLPPIGLSILCLRFFHYALRITTVQTVREPQADIQALYLMINELELDDIVLIAARAFIDPVMVDSSELLAVMPIGACESRVEAVKTAMPEIYSVYNFISHCCHGGANCINPIPNIIRSNPVLSEYINKISVGTETLFAIQIGIPPRLGSLPTAPFQSISHIPQPVQPIGTQSAQPTVSSQPPTATTQPARTFQHFRSIGSRAREEANLRLNAPQRESSDILLNQGDPSRNQIIRDTTTFRQSVQMDVDLLTNIEQCKSGIAENKAAIEALTAKIDVMLSRQDEANRTMAIMIAQSSVANLADREVMNRTLLSASNPIVSAAVSGVPPHTNLPSPQTADITTRLNNYPASGENGQLLLADVRSVLTRGGQGAFAANISQATIDNPRARARVIGKIAILPRG